jgi:hypothetical protein
MRIENLAAEQCDGRYRVAATVIWEDCDRPRREIYFEIDEAFAQHLSLNPHAFLVACLVPAMHQGEERISIDETICPELRNGLLMNMQWLQAWYGPSRQLVRIESRPGTRSPRLGREERVASFLSGGLDSLATLRANRLDFPRDHPRSIKDCLVVYGFDFGGRERYDAQADLFEHALSSITNIAQDAEVNLIRVGTNIRHLDDDIDFWMKEFHGAALAAVAHAVSNQLTRINIASTAKIPRTLPWGSHPLLDPNYGSTDLQLWHDGLRYSRLDKARLVAGWDVALQNIRVCNESPSDVLNCGRCEKCVRTMLEFLAAGGLDRASAFPASNLSCELVEEVLTVEELRYCVSEYSELIEPLAKQGRPDLAQVIQDRFHQLDKYLAWEKEQDWKGAVKRFDRKFFGSGLFNSYKVARTRIVKP